MGRGGWTQAFGLVVGGMEWRREDVGIVERIVVMGWDAADLRRAMGVIWDVTSFPASLPYDRGVAPDRRRGVPSSIGICSMWT
jgi:hypothetical protein